MPIREERRLKAAAVRRGLKPGTDRYNAYVYGTMQKIERRRKRKEKKR
jgi:hypothetical protein